MCLTGGFENFVFVGGEKIPIKTDFKVWLKADEILRSEAETTKKLVSALGLVYVKLPNSFFDAVSAMLEFYSGEEKKTVGEKQNRLFDFKQDGKLILAAFRQQYGINLLKEELHWHEFLALFSALGDETMFIKVMKIRGADLSKIKDFEKRRELARLKRIYSLDISEAEKKENERLILSLKKHGGGECNGKNK